MAFELRDGLEVDITVSGVDAEGNVAPIDAASPVSATSSNEAVATVGAGPDNASVTVKTTPGAGVGEVTISISGDGDAGEGVRPVSVDFVINVTAGDAATLTAVAGDPRPRTDVPA